MRSVKAGAPSSLHDCFLPRKRQQPFESPSHWPYPQFFTDADNRTDCPRPDSRPRPNRLCLKGSPRWHKHANAKHRVSCRANMQNCSVSRSTTSTTWMHTRRSCSMFVVIFKQHKKKICAALTSPVGARRDAPPWYSAVQCTVFL